MSDPRTNGGPDPRHPLRRDQQSKAVAGVCGGLGRHLSIDPVVFRILFVVFSFVGGLGLLAYAAAWLFVPQEGAEQSEAHRMLTGNSPWMAALMAIGLCLGAIAAVDALSNGLSGLWPMWLIAAAVFGLLVWRGDIKLGRSITIELPLRPATWWQQPVREGEAEADAGTGTETGPAGASPDFPQSPDEEKGVGGSEPRDSVPGQPPEREPSAMPSPTVPLGPGPDWGYDLGRGTEAGRPVRTRRRGYGGLVLAGLLAAGGALGVLNAAGVISLTWLSGGALVLLLLGGGMVLGGMFGKTTALVPVGLVLAVPLIALSALDIPLHGTIGDANWAPASAAAVRSNYQVGIGDGTLDLSQAAPGAGRTVRLSAQVAIGDLDITLPPGVEVQVQAHDGIGTVDAGDILNSSQLNYDGGFVIPAGAAHARGTIVLVVNVGIGDVNLEVAQ